MALEPVQLEIVGECHFRAKPCRLCGLPESNKIHKPKGRGECQFQRQNGCADCGRPKGDFAHFGTPPTFNVIVSRGGSGNVHVYNGHKTKWQELITAHLKETDLPRGLSKVFVEAELTFRDRLRRDQGNFRVILEKAMGDALKEGGWIDDDDWEHFEFGGLTYQVVPGEEATRITLFPVAKEEAERDVILPGMEGIA